MAKVIIDVPFTLATPLIFLAIIYFAVGFSATYMHFAKFLLTLELVAQVSQAMAYMTSAPFDTEDKSL